MNEILMTLLQTVAGVLSVVATAVVPVLLKKWMAKLGHEASAAEQEAIAKASRKAIGYAAEWAAKKTKTTNDPVKGAERMKVAMDLLKRQFPKALPADLEVAIESEIAFIAGVGASRPALGAWVDPTTTTNPGPGLIDQLGVAAAMERPTAAEIQKKIDADDEDDEEDDEDDEDDDD